ncbi:MAG: CBS domain-containing protein, partial [Bdellovibrionales bacterium]|nr:CBS domain-containing protein [Bdellovibrionales bacterium]
EMVVKDIMTARPAYVEPDTTVREVITKLFELDVRHLPVVDDGELVGIVSDRDLRSFSYPMLDDIEVPTEAQARLDAPISQIMHGDVASFDPETNVTEVIDFMVENKIGAVPVVDPVEGKLVGIISYIDVLKAAQTLLAD